MSRQISSQAGSRLYRVTADGVAKPQSANGVRALAAADRTFDNLYDRLQIEDYTSTTCRVIISIIAMYNRP